MTKNVAAKTWSRSSPTGAFFSNPGGGGGTFAFAPNMPSGLTVLSNRQWDKTDGTIPGGVLPPPSLSGTDSSGLTWAGGDGANQVPIIDTPANLSSIIGQTVPAPPDGHPTVLAIHYPNGEPGGTCPFQMYQNGVSTYKKVYLCCLVWMPVGFESTGNNIKWSTVQGHPAGGSANHIFMLCSGPDTDYRGVWMSLQGGHGNKELGGEDSSPDAVIQLQYPLTSQGTGPGWMKSGEGSWHVCEWFAQQESNPGVSADGIFWGAIDGEIINKWTDLTFNATSGDYNGFQPPSVIPYFGGGGNSSPGDQYILMGHRLAAAA